MPQQNLKSLIESGGYRPEPEQVAVAMLRRRGVRALLTGEAPEAGIRISAAGRTPPPAAPRRQAA